MKKTRLHMLLLSLGVTASMLLSACGGETPTDTAVPATTAPTTAPVTAATATTAPAAPTATTASTTAATATTGGAATGGNVVKIAVDLPVGGSEGSNGIPTRQGVQLAIDQANAAGGVTLDGKQYQLQMDFLDDVPAGGQAHDPAQGSKNANSFIADPDVMAMIGPFNSNVARAMMPKLNTAGLANISPSNTATDLTLPQFNPNLKDLRPTGKVTYFRVCTTDDIQGPVMADYAFNKLNLKKLYVLDDQEVYGKGIADQFQQEFQKIGGTVLGRDGVPKTTTDFSSIMSKVAATNPQAVYYGGTYSTGIAPARKAMKPAGLNVPLLGGDGIVASGYTDAANPDDEGDYGTVAAVNANLLPDAKTFIDAYKKAFASDQWKGEPQAYSANAYDATNIIIAALKTAGKKDREAVRAAIAATKDFKGAIGTTSFDANGDTTNRWISVYQVKSGAWAYIDQQQFTAAGTTGGTTPTTGGAAASGGTVKIAVDLPVGGSEGSNGIPTRQGVQLAIDQANAAGGVTLDGKQYQLQMDFLDDVPAGGQAHDPAQGSKNADSFIADPDVMAMIGPFNSNVARAMMPKLNTAGLANISPSNTATDLTLPQFNPNLKDLRPTGKVTYFRVCTTDNIQGPVMADYAFNKLNLKKLYVLDDQEVYGKGIADQFQQEFQKIGGTVLGRDGVPKTTTDFSSIMSKVAATNPQAVYYGGTYSTGIAPARKAMKPAGLNVPLLGGDGIVASGYTDAANPDDEGDYGTVAAVNANLLPDAKTFIDAYKKAFASDQWKGEPQAYSANAYDATNIIIAALKTAGKKDREAVRAAIAATKDFKGAIGTTSFDANGDTTNRWISVYQVKSGAWAYIDQQQFAAAP